MPAMSFRPLALPHALPGRMLLSAMPGYGEDWDVFVGRAQTAGITLAVCLNPLEEVAAASPAYYAAIASNALPFRWLHMPMRNFGLSDQAQAFRAGVEQIAAALERGDVVLLHCAAGMGRTGSTAACVLKRLGLNRDDALARVREAGSNPQSAAQTGLVDSF